MYTVELNKWNEANETETTRTTIDLNPIDANSFIFRWRTTTMFGGSDKFQVFNQFIFHLVFVYSKCLTNEQFKCISCWIEIFLIVSHDSNKQTIRSHGVVASFDSVDSLTSISKSINNRFFGINVEITFEILIYGSENKLKVYFVGRRFDGTWTLMDLCQWNTRTFTVSICVKGYWICTVNQLLCAIN